jgi:hypothetical protein
VIAAFEAAGKGTMQLDGAILDAPHLAQARRIIATCDRGQIRQRPNSHRRAWPRVAAWQRRKSPGSSVYGPITLRCRGTRPLSEWMK